MGSYPNSTNNKDPILVPKQSNLCFLGKNFIAKDAKDAKIFLIFYFLALFAVFAVQSFLFFAEGGSSGLGSNNSNWKLVLMALSLRVYDKNVQKLLRNFINST
jgi:hypothetical protein